MLVVLILEIRCLRFDLVFLIPQLGFKFYFHGAIALVSVTKAWAGLAAALLNTTAMSTQRMAVDAATKRIISSILRN